MTTIGYVTNAPAQSGMGRPARALRDRISGSDLQLDEFFLDGAKGVLTRNGEKLMALPMGLGPRTVKPLSWWRLSRHLPSSPTYPLWHLTNQSLSFIPRAPAIITVYDLIERLSPQQKFSSLLYRYLYNGLPKATHLISISEYTKKTIQETYAIPSEKISVIPLAVDERFVPLTGVKESLAYQLFLTKHRLRPDQPVILYVGSEHPRKNVAVVVRAFAKVRERYPNAVLVKVGDPGLASGREALLRTLDELNLRPHVRLIGALNDDDLQLVYSLANVFVFPSTFEGFGLPPLEAMACGCPVVTSNATSLPEVVGSAGLLCDPHDVEAFAASIERVISDPRLAERLSEAGQARARTFSWQRVAAETRQVYQGVLERLQKTT